MLASKLVENVLATPGIVVLVAHTSDPGNLNSPEMPVYAFESLSQLAPPPHASAHNVTDSPLTAEREIRLLHKDA